MAKQLPCFLARSHGRDYSGFLPFLTSGGFMPIVKLSSKGQLIIPASLRAAHHWQEGAEFLVEEVPEGLLLRPRKPFSTTRVSDGLGCVGYTGPPKTIDEMDQGIAELIRHDWLEQQNTK